MQTTHPVHDLAPHPRLHLCETAARPSAGPPGPVTERIERRLAAAAQECLDLTGIDDVPVSHNGHLIRARRMQRRIVTLLAQWTRTGEQRYRDAVLACVDAMGRWEYWSWITWRRGDARPESIFDLSYGENSATLAVVHDLLHDSLDDNERQHIVTIARDRALQPFLHVVERGEAWWFGKDDSNWNTVCAGGAGMLALSMAEELPEQAHAVLPLVEESVAPFMRALEATDGGWPEGIGYWAYGMSYAFAYLLSHERATGAPHPLLRAEATRRTVEFPLDFWPYGQACSFGDSNHFGLAPVHVRVAELLGCDDVVRAVRPMINGGAFEDEHEPRPHSAEALLLGLRLDDPIEEADASLGSDDRPAAVRSYPGLGWTRMADRWPDPSFYLAIRGGLSGVPHGHRDLLSFHAVVGREHLIENLTPREYLDTTFGGRREELFEMGPQSKNAPLIDGVGVVNDAEVEPYLFEIEGFVGVRLDAAAAMGVARSDEPLAHDCSRTFVLLGDRGALVLDRFELAHDGRVETRLHTRAEVSTDGSRAVLTGTDEHLTVVHAASGDVEEPFGLVVAPITPTTPGDDATLLRWHGPTQLGRSSTVATLLAAGDVEASVELRLGEGQLQVALRISDWSHTLTL